MQIRYLFVKRKPRSFDFTPFYYKEKESKKIVEDAPRIRFRQIRTRITVGKRSVRSMLILTVIIIAMFIYFMRLVEQDLTTSELENIRIEEVPSN